MTAPQQVASTAKDEATNVGGTAAAAAADVAGTAKEQAADVLGESLDQAKDLAGQARAVVAEQVSTQGEKLTASIRALSDQLTQKDTSGVIGDVLTEVGQRLQKLVDRVEQSGPDGLVTDLRSYVKSSPGTFLVGAALAGLTTGRVAKGIKAGAPTPEATTGAVPAPSTAGTATGQPLAGRTTPMGTGVDAGYAPSTEPGVSYEPSDVRPTPLADAYPTDTPLAGTTQEAYQTRTTGGLQ